MPARALQKAPTECKHSRLRFISPSYRSIEKLQKIDRRISGRKAKVEIPSTFPDPLVLPGDELASDEVDEEQSLQDWVEGEDRNGITAERNVVYVAAPPSVASNLHLSHSVSSSEPQVPIQEPNIQDIVEYISAFYYGLSVKLLPPEALEFTEWDSKRRKGSRKAQGGSATPSFVGLQTATECVRIRNRPSPDGIFQCQLNLDDLVDTAISALPSDAYALIMLVRYDLYDDEEDEFQCGGAYGGSRVAVVSLARYNPNLDAGHGVERDHAWPASHCDAYVESCVQASQKASRPRKKARKCTAASSKQTAERKGSSSAPPMQSAIDAYTRVFPSKQDFTQSQLAGMWLARVCRTMTHELGHCFGMAHCVYYACSMQGTASIAEDARQPPYLCPIDLAKLLQATGASMGDRYEQIACFCERYSDNQMFTGYGAWIRGRLNREKRLT